MSNLKLKKILPHIPSFLLIAISLVSVSYGVYLENRIILIHAEASPYKIHPNDTGGIDISNDWHMNTDLHCPWMKEFKTELLCL